MIYRMLLPNPIKPRAGMLPGLLEETNPLQAL
jgi:hypothetical protein